MYPRFLLLIQLRILDKTQIVDNRKEEKFIVSPKNEYHFILKLPPCLPDLTHYDFLFSGAK